jgi:hypothetical protein
LVILVISNPCEQIGNSRGVAWLRWHSKWGTDFEGKGLTDRKSVLLGHTCHPPIFRRGLYLFLLSCSPRFGSLSCKERATSIAEVHGLCEYSGENYTKSLSGQCAKERIKSHLRLGECLPWSWRLLQECQPFYNNRDTPSELHFLISVFLASQLIPPMSTARN